MKFKGVIMLHSVEMTIEDLNIEIQIGAGGSIEEIFVDGQQPDGVEFDIIEENLQKIEREIAWRWYQDQEE